MNKLTFLSVAILVAAAGCQQDASTKKKTGSYTAARHFQTGSNIPQPYSATTVGETYDPQQFADAQHQQTNLTGGTMAGSAGGR